MTIAKDKLESSYFLLDEVNTRVKEHSLSIKRIADATPKEVVNDIGDFCTLIDELRRNLSVMKQVIQSSELSLKRMELENDRREMAELKEQMKLLEDY